MRVAVFSTKPYDRRFLDEANRGRHDLVYLEPRLDDVTASLADGCKAVCVFVNDRIDAPTIEILAQMGVRLIALRAAGYNNVDLAAAERLGIDVVRVPAYSPHAVAEFTIGLLLSLDRKIHRAWARVRDNNFALEGLLGTNLHGKTVAVIGTGRIGGLVARALKLGFGCRVFAADQRPDPELEAIGIVYGPAASVAAEADIITLHCPLTPETHHLVNSGTIARARRGFMLINTSRGALVDAEALIEGLKSGQVGGVALDVYEQEGDLFFRDLSNEIIQDDVFQRLLTFPNVLVTGHQAFFTAEALAAIAATTIDNISAAAEGRPLENRVATAEVIAS